MKDINPIALIFYAMILLAGYCLGGIHGLGISAIISAILIFLFG
jgi:hypothetical protein